MSSDPTLCVLGGNLDTGNLGVAALGTAAVKGILEAFPSAKIMFQTWGGERRLSVPLAGRPVEVEAICVHRAESLRWRFGTRHLKALYRVTRHLPGPLARWLVRSNRTLSGLLRSDAILDVCGGDSFADIYGPAGMELQLAPKRLAMDLGLPLVLLPQTYGPFDSERSRDLARQIINYSSLVATRDVRGVDELVALCNGQLHDRVVCCPDMAFLLDPLPVDLDRESFLKRIDHRPLIGLNVSGLLYLSQQDHRPRDPYPALIDAIIGWAIERCGARVVLVPHVLATQPLPDDLTGLDRSGDVSDTAACKLLMSRLRDRYADRIGCLGGPYNAGQTKYLAGQCDFFIGARMHACIGAACQNVPTVTLAYSKKARGVMGLAGIEECVLDLRALSIAGCLERIDSLFDRRAELAALLGHSVPRVQAEARRFFSEHLPKALGRTPMSHAATNGVNGYLPT